MSDILAFNEWGTDGIVVEDPGLINYITLQPRFVPKTGARYAGSRFHKSKIFIVERLMNKLMVPGHKAKKHWRSSVARNREIEESTSEFGSWFIAHDS